MLHTPALILFSYMYPRNTFCKNHCKLYVSSWIHVKQFSSLSVSNQMVIFSIVFTTKHFILPWVHISLKQTSTSQFSFSNKANNKLIINGQKTRNQWILPESFCMDAWNWRTLKSCTVVLLKMPYGDKILFHYCLFISINSRCFANKWCPVSLCTL